MQADKAKARIRGEASAGQCSMRLFLLPDASSIQMVATSGGTRSLAGTPLTVDGRRAGYLACRILQLGLPARQASIQEQAADAICRGIGLRAVASEQCGIAIDGERVEVMGGQVGIGAAQFAA